MVPVVLLVTEVLFLDVLFTEVLLVVLPEDISPDPMSPSASGPVAVNKHAGAQTAIATHNAKGSSVRVLDVSMIILEP